mmetsp:Transcript_34408/g.85678  ORF Transcript_34408/g.85678 Transcript_34408/m.85678 type:complete len:205 (+) Transcript_34408:478-1092(+)
MGTLHPFGSLECRTGLRARTMEKLPLLRRTTGEDRCISQECAVRHLHLEKRRLTRARRGRSQQSPYYAPSPKMALLRLEASDRRAHGQTVRSRSRQGTYIRSHGTSRRHASNGRRSLFASSAKLSEYPQLKSQECSALEPSLAFPICGNRLCCTTPWCCVFCPSSVDRVAWVQPPVLVSKNARAPKMYLQKALVSHNNYGQAPS